MKLFFTIYLAIICSTCSIIAFYLWYSKRQADKLKQKLESALPTEQLDTDTTNNTQN